MALDINPSSGVPIYRQVVDQIRREIVSGQLEPGAQLTSVRDLAADLRVNPMTISKAYSLLEVEGLVERRRGIGLFVAELRARVKDEARRELIEDLFRDAASSACQLDMDEDEAVSLLRTWYRYFSSGRHQ
jgi:GntR family transcriptional regulator